MSLYIGQSQGSMVAQWLRCLTPILGSNPTGTGFVSLRETHKVPIVLVNTQVALAPS